MSEAIAIEPLHRNEIVPLLNRNSHLIFGMTYQKADGTLSLDRKSVV